MGNKVLWFEGAGCAERGDVPNCRIRTAFRNDKGDVLYLEISGMEVTKHTPKHLKHFKNVGWVDHCHYIHGGNDDCNNYPFHVCERNRNFEYSQQGILKFVNEELGCSFTEIKVADSFFRYRVHGAKGVSNLMDDHTFDEEHAAKARAAFTKIDYEIRERLGEKYSKISLCEVNDDSLTVRCYASNESMRSHGMNPDQREIVVKF